MKLNVIYKQGGMYEFAKTGVYPRSIEIHDPVLNKTWRRKITEANCSGELKLDRKIIYSYHVDIENDLVSLLDCNKQIIEDCSILCVLDD
jgi:hypothetical protein